MEYKMGIDTGAKARLEILKRDSEQQIVSPFTSHGWDVTLASELDGECSLIYHASKENIKKRIAVLYSESSSKQTYAMLDSHADIILINGSAENHGRWDGGIQTEVISIKESLSLLIRWNREITPPKKTKPVDAKKQIRRVTTERPLERIWYILNQYASIELAKKLIQRRHDMHGKDISSEILTSKAIGLSYTIKNASDYFKAAPHESYNKRVISLYYGTLSLAFAEMLASPGGASGLDEVEGMTKQGHGLYTVPSEKGTFNTFNVGVLATGFFPRWMDFLNVDISDYPKRKPKSASDLDTIPFQFYATIENLISSIPDLGDMLSDVFNISPSWFTVAFDMSGNPRISKQEKSPSSYINLYDHSGIFDFKRISSTSWPITEVNKVDDKDPFDEGNVIKYRARVDHEGYDYWHEVLPLRKSSFTNSQFMVVPVLGGNTEYRANALAILYALSIMVRYMPSLWRRVEGGDQDQYFTTVQFMLDIFERNLPHEFLESISDERIVTGLPGGLF